MLLTDSLTCVGCPAVPVAAFWPLLMLLGGGACAAVITAAAASAAHHATPPSQVFAGP